MTEISKLFATNSFEKAIEAALAREKQAAIETFYAYLGISHEDDLVLKHVPLMDIRWANIQMFASPECQLFAEQQYERWHQEYEAVIADDPDADLSGLNDEDEDNEYSGASEWPRYDSDEAMFMFCTDDDDEDGE